MPSQWGYLYNFKRGSSQGEAALYQLNGEELYGGQFKAFTLTERSVFKHLNGTFFNEELNCTPCVCQKGITGAHNTEFLCQEGDYCVVELPAGWYIYLIKMITENCVSMYTHKSLYLQTMMGECCKVGRFRKHLQVSWGFCQSLSDSVWPWEVFLLLVFILILNFSSHSSHFFRFPFALVQPLLQFTTKLQLLSLHISNSCADLQSQFKLKGSKQKILADTNRCVIYHYIKSLWPTLLRSK